MRTDVACGAAFVEYNSLRIAAKRRKIRKTQSETRVLADRAPGA